MTVSQSANPETLKRFNAAIMRMGRLYGPYGPYKTQTKPYYMCQVFNFERVQAAIALLWQFLSTEKQEQAKNVLVNFLKQPINLRNRLKTHCPSGHEYTEENTYVVPKSSWRQCKICRNRRL